MVKAVPDGAHTVTPHLIVDGAAKAIDFYVKAFGAKELSRIASPDGKLMHAALQFGDSQVFLCDDFGDACGGKAPAKPSATTLWPCLIHLYLEDVDKRFQQAVDAGCDVVMPLTDMFWGDRYGQLDDPFGHRWSLSMHVKDMSPEDMQKAAQECFAAASAK